MGRKETIRQAAIKVIARKGFANARPQLIAEEAGISVGSIYHYFVSKEDVLDYIFEVEFAKRTRLLEELGKSNIPFVDKMKRFMEFHFTELEKNPDTAKVLIQETMSPAIQKIEWVQKTMVEIPRIFIDMLYQAKEKGEIRDINPELVGPAIFHASRGLAYTLQQQNKDNMYKEAQNQLIDVILDGIR